VEVIDLEHWTDFKGAISGWLSFCRDTILIGAKWSTEAGTYVRIKKERKKERKWGGNTKSEQIVTAVEMSMEQSLHSTDTWHYMISNPDLRCEMPATNRLVTA
jgi:hypothetical protein